MQKTITASPVVPPMTSGPYRIECYAVPFDQPGKSYAFETMVILGGVVHHEVISLDLPHAIATMHDLWRNLERSRRGP